MAKPSGIATTHPRGGDCLVRRVRELLPDAPRLHPVSRLDAEVSGLVTFALTRRATKVLAEAREAGDYRRAYVALAAAPPDPSEGVWSAPIGIDPRDPRKRQVAEGLADRRLERTQHAVTRYRTGAVVELAAVLHLYPETGRTHQLRVHAAHAGCALLGDRHYGGPRRIVGAGGIVFTARRVMLHCARLRLPDVARGSGGLELTLDAPADLRELWLSFGGSAAALDQPVASGSCAECC